MRRTIPWILALLFASVLLTVCGRTSPPPKEDTTPPTVISEYPGNKSINNSTTISIVIGFSEEIDAATIGPTTILVSDGDSNQVQGDISYDRSVVTFKPRQDLKHSTTYVVTVTSGVSDKEGNNLANPVYFVFTTGVYVDTIPPQVYSWAPTGTSVQENASIIVTFDEEMLPWTFTPQSISVSYQSATAGTVNISGDVQTFGKMVSFQPLKSLDNSTTYTVVVSENVTDLSSNPLGQPYSWQFTTVAPIPDTTSPNVLESIPTGTNVLVTASIVAIFDERMMTTTITPSTMILTEKNKNGVLPGTVNASVYSAMLTPATELTYDTEYIVTLIPGYSGSPGITDEAGNPLVANSPSGWSWTFRTERFPSPVIVATAGPGGAITPQGNVLVTYGTATTFTIAPLAGYHIVDVLVDGVSAGAVASHTFTNVVANHTIAASFAINTYKVTPSAGANGNISPSIQQTVNHGATQQFIVTPYAGYTAVMGGTCGGSLDGTTYTTNAVTGNCTVTATFSLNTVTITATAGANGTISPSGSVAVDYGSNPGFTITPNPGYHVVNVMVDGLSAGAVTSYMFSNVTAPHTISATFAIDTFTVTATAGAGGTISPASRLVSYNSTTTFTVTPTAGYTAVMGGTCGGSLAGTTYTTNAITGNCTVTATFSLNTVTITATAGANGTISPSGSVAADYGSSPAFTITPATGYHVADVLVDGLSVGAVTSHQFTNVIANHTISATFAIDTFIITASTGTNGTISPSGAVSVNYGASQTFTFTPDTGYRVAAVTADGVPAAPANSYTFTNVTAAHTIAVSFAINTYTIAPTAGPGGTIIPSASVLVNYGGSRQFTIVPDTGYHITDVLVDGISVGAVATYTFTNVTVSHTISATFAIDTFTVTATAGAGGTISPASRLVSYNSTTTFTVAPNAGYTAVMGGTCGGSLAGTTYTTNAITGNCTVTATFSLNTVTITATAGPNGTISPSGSVAADYGSNPAFTITPATGYHVADVLADGLSVGAVASYTFTNVTGPHTISATFAIDTFTVTATAGAGGTISPASRLVSYNSTTTFTVTPNTGYAAAMGGTCGGALVGTTYTTNAITANCTVTATFSLNTVTITATAGPNGTLSPSGSVAADYGSSPAFTITPATGYHVADVLVDGVSVGAVANYTFTNVTVSHTISATFAIDIFIITASTGTNGTISPSGAVPVNNGASQIFTFTPNAGYHVSAITVDGVPAAPATSYTFTNITASHTITVDFAINSYTITPTAGPGGTITPAAAVPVNHGGSRQFTIAPDTGYHITDVLADGVSVGAISSYTFTNVTADHTISATFAIDTFTVTASAGVGGTISPASQLVSYGSATTFTVAPDTGYTAAAVGGTCGGTLAGTTYTTNAVTAPCTVTATFTLNSYTVTATAGSGGTIAPPSQPVNHGSTTTFTITPDTGYSIGTVGGTCGGTLAGNIYTTNAIIAPCTVDAAFTLNSYTVTATAGSGGSIVCTPSTVIHGGSSTCTITPDQGYHVLDVVVDGVSAGPVTSYTFTSVTANRAISASFTINTYTVSTSAGEGGTIAPSSQLVNHGGTTTFTVNAATGSYITSISGCGGTTFTNTDISVTTYEYATGVITGICTVTASYEIVTLPLIGATQGMGMGSLGATAFLFNPALYRILSGWRTRKTRKRPGGGTDRRGQSGMRIARREREP